MKVNNPSLHKAGNQESIPLVLIVFLPYPCTLPGHLTDCCCTYGFCFTFFAFQSDVWQLYNLLLMDVGKLEQDWDACCIIFNSWWNLMFYCSVLKTGGRSK